MIIATPKSTKNSKIISKMVFDYFFLTELEDGNHEGINLLVNLLRANGYTDQKIVKIMEAKAKEI